MNLDINDPRITAFALGELQGSDAAEIARAVRNDPKIRAAVDEVRETSFSLMEVFGGEAPMLTAAQRQKVRSAGGVVIAEIEQVSQRRELGWKKTWLTGVGAAAAVALALYMVGGGWTGTSDLADSSKEQKQVSSSPRRSVSQIPGHVEGRWESVKTAGSQSVPMRSGKGSWALLQSYVNEQHALPPRGSVRIEEILNHFNYAQPSQLKSVDGSVVVDVEACVAPWNARRWLVAVHVEAESPEKLESSALSLTFDPDQVSRVRLLGYGVSKTAKVLSKGGGERDRITGGVNNYVIYELEPAKSAEIDGTGSGLAALSLADKGSLAVSVPSDGTEASEDLRFASLVVATGMWMSDTELSEELTKERILDEIKSFHSDTTATLSEKRHGLSEERREALSLIRKVLALPLSRQK